MVHDNKKCGTRFKNWRKNMANAKVQRSWKINIKEKELLQRKRKVISASTQCKSTSPYMVSQEVVLRLSAWNQKQNGVLASKLWRLLFLLRKLRLIESSEQQFNSVSCYFSEFLVSQLEGFIFFCQFLNLKPHFFSWGLLFLLSKI